MMNYIKNVPKHFITAIKGVARHMAMTISSASAVAVTLTLMALFLLLAGNVTNFTTHVETDLKIHVNIDNIKTEDEIVNIQEEITNIKGIKSVTYSSKKDELNALIKENGEVFERYKDNNPMNNAFIIEVEKASQIDNITKKLMKVDGVEDAQYGGESIDDMIQAFTSLRFGGFIFLLGLAFIAIFLISNTIKMTIYTRKTEIAIMRHVGANNGYIKMPFMFEGMFIGILGALLPILLTSIGYSAVYNILDGKLLSSMLVLQKPFPFAFMICVALIVSGAVVGVLGSFHAVNKYLRWSR